MAENRCVACGEIIPEGTQVCQICKAKVEATKPKEPEKPKFDIEQFMMDWVLPLGMLGIAIYIVVWLL